MSAAYFITRRKLRLSWNGKYSFLLNTFPRISNYFIILFGRLICPEIVVLRDYVLGYIQILFLCFLHAKFLACWIHISNAVRCGITWCPRWCVYKNDSSEAKTILAWEKDGCINDISTEKLISISISCQCHSFIFTVLIIVRDCRKLGKEWKGG